MALAILLFPATAPGSEPVGDAGCGCRKAISGHFIDAHRTEELVLCARTRDAGCPGGFMPERFSDTRWALLHRTDGQSRVPDAISTLLNEYDYTALIGTCRDAETGLDQILFSAGWSGSANGNRRDAVFVYYDREARMFSSLVMDAEYVGDDCSRKQAMARRFRRKSLRKAGFALYRGIQPKPAEKGPFGWRPLPGFNPQRIRAKLAAWNQRLERTRAQWHGDAERSLPRPRFTLEQLAGNARWRVISISYLESSAHAWGVLLARDGNTGRWFSFYDMPGGSDKRWLFRPERPQLRGDVLSLSLCTECEGWGRYARFTAHLDRLARRTGKLNNGGGT